MHSHAFRVHVYPRARGDTCIIPSVRPSSHRAPRARARRRGPPSRSRISVPWLHAETIPRTPPRAARSGATEVGRSTVTAGCTAEAYANRLDFARMAFLFVVKNGACEPRFPRRPTSTRATMRAIFLAIPARARTCSHVTIYRVALSSFRSLYELHIRIFLVQVYFVRIPVEIFYVFTFVR